MATLQSPGVQVSVIDESFYTPAAPGTVPMIFVATAQDKSNASATGTAAGTLKANAGKVWTITSQRDLTDTFGVPKFYVDASNNPIHGGELNEYGLQAAYSFLGASSKAYIVRADIDLSELEASADAPKGDPVSGTYWLDTGSSLFGINEWDATNAVFVSKTPLVINDVDNADYQSGLVPTESFGSKGDYAVVATSDNEGRIYYKNGDNNWVLLGTNVESHFGTNQNTSTFVSTAWKSSFPVLTSTGFGYVDNANTLVINGNSITLGTTSTVGVASSINNQVMNKGIGAKINDSGKLEIYTTASTLAISGTAVSSLGLTAGTYTVPQFTIAPHTQVPQYGTSGAPAGSAYIKTTKQSKGANWTVKYYNGATKSWGTVEAPIYATSEAAIKALDSAGGKNIAAGQLYIESNFDHGDGTFNKPNEAIFKVYRRISATTTKITGDTDITTWSPTSGSFTIAATAAGSLTLNQATITLTTATTTGAQIVALISAANITNVSAALNSDGTLSITHALGGDLQLTEAGGHPILDALGFSAYDIGTGVGTANLYAAGQYDTYTYRASNWKPLVFESKSSAPYTEPTDGTLWYDANYTEVDIMYHNGTTWVGYRDSTAFPNSDPNGPQIKATEPTKQSDGVTDLVTGDIWIDSSDSELYGKNVYVYNGSTGKWVKQDVTDQETPTGWLFADARWAASGQATEKATIKALLSSNYLDPDSPDPASYPQGMRLWNLRRSGFNVKKYVNNSIDIYSNSGLNDKYNDDVMDGSGLADPYNPDRWVTVSPNAEDGSGTFGRKAQRGFIVSAFKSLVDTNTNIRDTDTLVFNLIACPGYVETLQNMAAFNGDRGYTAFVVGDTPFRLAPTGTTLANWGNNTGNVTDNGDDGLVTYDSYTSVFYPSGYTTDNSGNKIVVPPSHMMLRTIAISDQKSYQWFAPAGIRRGGVDNATSVGYLDNGSFITTPLPTDIRDVMNPLGINPIATLNGVGIVNFGNNTRSKGTSSLGKINVARLVAYLRRQLDILSRPFLFEPNDKNTRTELKNAAESLLLELVGQRALYDYIVVCDESNNTAARIDRSELWMDIAIEPVKAVEYIYIPLRLKNTGDIKAGR